MSFMETPGARLTFTVNRECGGGVVGPAKGRSIVRIHLTG